MDPQGELAARMIESGIRAIAADVALGQEGTAGEGDPEASVRFKDLADETAVRLRYLAAAAATGEPALFAAHVGWTAAAWEARGVSVALLEANLRCIRDVLATELPDATLPSVQAVLDAGLAGLAAGVQAPPSLLDGVGDQADLARRFLLALLEKRRDDAIRLVLDAAASGLPMAELHDRVIGPAQAEVGRLWQLGEVNVAEEHLGSRIVEDALALLRHQCIPATSNGRCILVCSPPGDLHDIGGRIVADRFEAAGWESLFLGANTPVPDLVSAVEHFHVDALLLSVSLAVHLLSCADTIRRLREELGDETPKVLAGGAPFAAANGLWRAVGADGGGSSALEALREADRLLAA